MGECPDLSLDPGLRAVGRLCSNTQKIRKGHDAGGGFIGVHAAFIHKGAAVAQG